MNASRASIRMACALLGAAAAVVGCNYIIPANYILQGPPKEPAAYALQSRKTIVVVDDKQNRMSRVALRVEIGDAAGTELLENDVVPEVISTRDSVALARRLDTAAKPVSIQRIGESLGAEQVIYVEVDEFVLAGGRKEGGPEAVVLVKVIDAANGTRLWPSVGAQAVQSDLLDINPSLLETSAGRREIEDKLAAQIGEDVAKLFYEHPRRELGGRLGVKK